MVRIMIMCPETNTPVSTGIVTADRETFEKEIIMPRVLDMCSACGKDHPWHKEIAFVQES
jgi:hypothetical protein